MLNYKQVHKLFVKGYKDFKENGMKRSGSCLADNIESPLVVCEFRQLFRKVEL